MKKKQPQINKKKVKKLPHKKNCPYYRAMTCAVGIECAHGYDVCPMCDPCTCDDKKNKTDSKKLPNLLVGPLCSKCAEKIMDRTNSPEGNTECVLKAAHIRAHGAKTLQGKMTVKFIAQEDGQGGWDVTEPISALCICECSTRENAELIAKKMNELVK